MLQVNIVGLIIILFNFLLIIFLPRKWAAIPILIGTCYLTRGQGIEIGPFHFHAIRIFITLALARILIRGEKFPYKINELDKTILAWVIWALISSLFHDDPIGSLINRMGYSLDFCGTYFIFRVFCRSVTDFKNVCRVLAILLLPVAVEMVYESLANHNLFSMLGGVREIPTIRDDRTRAQGPFAHAILAGTVGAVTLPLFIGVFREHKMYSIIGAIACTTIIVTCSSSGPIISVIAGMGSVALFRYRKATRFFRWAFVIGYILMEILMKDPAYYLIARADIIGGSTGWHRAYLIQSALNHISEWWIVGTDYTRHWMPYGVSWSPNHSDITNHYIQNGVMGGIILVLIFITKLYFAFSFVGKSLTGIDCNLLRKSEQVIAKCNLLNYTGVNCHSKNKIKNLIADDDYFIWCVGSALFSLSIGLLSVSYFDQSYVFLYFIISGISACYNEKTNPDSKNL